MQVLPEGPSIISERRGTPSGVIRSDIRGPPLSLKEKISFKCSYCHAEYSTKESLEAHQTLSHTEHFDKLPDKRFRCKYCDKIFVARISIQEHVSAAHLTDGAHICMHCGGSFYSVTSLIRHEKIHVVARAFSCDMCEKTFKTRPAMRKHKKYVHKVRMRDDLRCAWCSRAFKNLGALEAHEVKYHPEVTDEDGEVERNEVDALEVLEEVTCEEVNDEKEEEDEEENGDVLIYEITPD
ncbi:zinc finger protein 184-like [Anthonomus grandis grandis]|uniref:zinc finger protein 184-like n=1 Tax=Anthonomus grandis grandis TaxID=2921223 RepID=UPI00216505F5|nr:zinc finger protein 184-like [Anthonomus grandis grandis]